MEYMSRLVSDYLNPEEIEWLPFSIVTSRPIKPHRLSNEEMGHTEKEAFCAQLRDAYAEEKSILIRLAKPVVPDDALDKVRDRFQILFKTEKNRK